MKNFWKFVIGGTLVYFFAWVFIFNTGINTHAIQSEDTLPAIFQPLAILKDKTLYLDKYYMKLLLRYPHPDDRSFQKGLVPFYLRKVEVPEHLGVDANCYGESACTKTHYVSAFPIISGLLAVPVYIIPVILQLQFNWQLLFYLNHLAAALIVSFAGGFLYLLVKRHFSLNEKQSVLLGLIYLFGSVNFAMVSQSLWQHGTLQLFLILTLLFLYEKKYFWFSFMFSMAVLSRQTALFWAPIIGIFFLYKIKDSSRIKNNVTSATLGILLPLAFFIWYNSSYYLGIANQGYSNHIFQSWLGRFPEGFLGIWLSPSKGILIYSPVFIFSLVGIYLATTKGKWKKNMDYVFFGLIILIQTLVMGKWKHWYGGYSFGYRMASDIIPLLVLLLIPYFKSNIFYKYRRLFGLTLIISVMVQLFGIVFFDSIWHAAYDLGFEDTSWLWSLKDSEFAFNLRRILVKLNFLDRACPQCLPG